MKYIILIVLLILGFLLWLGWETKHVSKPMGNSEGNSEAYSKGLKDLEKRAKINRDDPEFTLVETEQASFPSE